MKTNKMLFVVLAVLFIAIMLSLCVPRLVSGDCTTTPASVECAGMPRGYPPPVLQKEVNLSSDTLQETPESVKYCIGILRTPKGIILMHFPFCEVK